MRLRCVEKERSRVKLYGEIKSETKVERYKERERKTEKVLR